MRKRSIRELTKWEDVEKELIKNGEFREESRLLEPQFETFRKVLELRLRHKMSQEELAKRINTKQPSIARLERGLENPTVYFLSRIAAAFGKKLVIDFK